MSAAAVPRRDARDESPRGIAPDRRGGGAPDLLSAIQSLAFAHDVPSIGPIVRRAVRELVGADGATLVLRHGDECHEVDEDAFAAPGNGQRFTLMSGIAGWVMLARQAAVIFDVSADPRGPREAYRPAGVRSLAMVPVGSEDPVGAIGAYWATPHEATPDEVALLQALADATALAMRHVELVRGLENGLAREAALRARAEAAAARLHRIQAVTEAALMRDRLEEVPLGLLQAVRKALDADTATVLTLDEPTTTLVELVSEGLGVDGDEAARVPVGHGFAGLIAATREPVALDDLSQHEALRPSLRARVRSVLGVPLLAGDRLLGVLHVGSATPRTFTADDRALLALVGERLAVVLRQAALHEAERRAREQAEAASRAKDEFLAMLGHELRNPLGAIGSAISLLDQVSKPDDATVRPRQIIARQVRQLAGLVDDLLDVARIRAGRIVLQRAPVDLKEVVERGIASLALRGRTDHDLTFTGGPLAVEGDPARLEQIVWNLLDNAVKYTPAGGRISVTLRPEGDDGVLGVADTGVGIDADLLPRVFEPFIQSEQSLDRAPGGLGLGLTLVKRLVEAHGGTVAASSPGPGQGSVLEVRLPRLARMPDRPAVATARPLPPPPCRVLVIDDHDDFREAIRRLLTAHGHEVEEAEDGRRGLDKLRMGRPDVALIDVGLPGLDGYALARAARAYPDTVNVRLIALTGYGQPEDRRRALEAGFDAHLVKPVEEAVLLEALGFGAESES